MYHGWELFWVCRIDMSSISFSQHSANIFNILQWSYFVNVLFYYYFPSPTSYPTSPTWMTRSCSVTDVSRWSAKLRRICQCLGPRVRHSGPGLMPVLVECAVQTDWGPTSSVHPPRSRHARGFSANTNIFWSQFWGRNTVEENKARSTNWLNYFVRR